MTQLFGTIYGSYDYTFEGKGAWVGHAILSFDAQPPVKATIVDRNTSLNRRADGAICGTEVITVTIPEKGSFDVLANFTGTPASTPGLYTLDETGRIANGTGAYDQLAGNVVVKGPFLIPDPATTPGAPPWIAEIHGAIQGLS
jgi:hypothetical protein